jgi:hypothetical protein
MKRKRDILILLPALDLMEYPYLLSLDKKKELKLREKFFVLMLMTH